MDEEDWEDEEDEFEAARPRARRRTPGDLSGLAIGWLAMLPLFLAYEFGLSETAGVRRNAGERLVFLALDPLGDVVTYVRWFVLAAGGLAAWLFVRSRGEESRNGVARVTLEGGVLAVALGPVLLGALLLLERWVPRLDASWDPAGRVPELDGAALVFGGAAWEELCFRVGGYGLVFVVVRVVALAFGLGERAASRSADALGLFGSSLLFAAFHLAAFTSWLGHGGAEFDPALFTWLLLAGILLGLVFRLRGAGVAAWTHGLFNLFLLLGVDPDLLQ